MSLHSRMKPLLAVLLVLCFVAPEWAMGGWGVDLRLPAVLGTLAFARPNFALGRHAILLWPRPLWPSPGCRRPRWPGTGSITTSVSRSSVPPTGCSSQDRKSSRCLTATLWARSDQPYWHMAEYAIVDRSGFTPAAFHDARPARHRTHARCVGHGGEIGAAGIAAGHFRAGRSRGRQFARRSRISAKSSLTCCAFSATLMWRLLSISAAIEARYPICPSRT